MRIFKAFAFAFLITFNILNGQAPKKPSATDIYHQLQKINFLGTALYIAAHPDDENTRLISYLSNNVKARTAYLSITRGDGGQNLIGAELRELLGVLRTQELLAARRVDGGEQRFTRANDFGYSKHPDETLALWDKEHVLGDVVWAIRNLKPDVIINRFDHRTPGSTHGHHTSSAMLSVEAFDLVNNPNAYPEQLKTVNAWQPKRLFFNTSWWFYGSEENFEKADKSNMVQMDVGVYYPILGVSNNEIASLASSQHLCQGFGRITTRGSQEEYIEYLKGEPLQDNTDIFDGINTTWSRIKGGEAIGKILYDVEANFNFKDTSIHIPQLIQAYQLMQNIEDGHWRKLKSKAMEELILACGGIFIEANAESASSNPGTVIKLTIQALNRSNTSVLIKELGVAGHNKTTQVNTPLLNNQMQTYDLTLEIPETTPYTSPYWLNEKGSLGMYKVQNRELIGQPETPQAFNVDFVMDMGGTEITIQKPVIYRYSKPDKGEIYEPFVVMPKISARFENDVLIFASQSPKRVPVALKAGQNDVKGIVTLNHPQGWTVHPAAINFAIAQKGEVQTVYFGVSPPSTESEGSITPSVLVDGQEFTKELIEINYDHIPKQSILLPAESKVVRLNIEKIGDRIGYIVGAGDKVPESLEQIGYKVELININEIEMGSLKKYDGIVLGIRAYNVLDELQFKQDYLLDYVKNGGNLIVQYNTAGRWRNQFENIAPYPLTVSRDRVADENAAVDIIAKEHPVINTPNKITNADFDGWVQERGLYFPSEWSDEFSAILSMNDAGETPKAGSLLIAPYGKGNYIYTGLSFFRELPAGVSGAYKLFANMLSLGKDNKNKSDEVKR
ncbi:MAG: LmbE family protein [Croceitalea sp.]|nr:LmbE family protein [Croceitalea sp.]